MTRKTRSESSQRFGASLEHLAFFRAFVDAFEKHGCESFEEIGRRLGVSRSYVSHQIKTLEQRLSARQGETVCLAERAEREGIIDLTEAGRRLRSQIGGLFDKYDQCVAVVAGGAGQPGAKVRIAAIPLVHDYVLAGAIADHQQRATQEETRVEVKVIQEPYPAGVVEKLEYGEAEIGVGPTLKILGSRRVTVEPAMLSTPMCLVCDPLHSRGRTGTNRPVQRADLAENELLLLDARICPDMGAAIRQMSARRLAGETMASMEGVMNRVQMEGGIGLVPAWPWVFRDRIQQGRIVMLPAASFGRYEISVYRLRGKRLSAGARGFLNTLRTHCRALERMSRQYVSPRRDRFPASISQYRNGYYLSSVGWHRPIWRRCMYEWSKGDRGGKIMGHGTDLHSRRTYDVAGLFEQDMASWIGACKDKKAASDIFAATFVSHTVSPEALVGTWTGFNDENEPVTGAFVLSIEELDFYQVSELAWQSKVRLFLNADPHRCESS